MRVCTDDFACVRCSVPLPPPPYIGGWAKKKRNKRNKDGEGRQRKERDTRMWTTKLQVMQEEDWLMHRMINLSLSRVWLTGVVEETNNKEVDNYKAQGPGGGTSGEKREWEQSRSLYSSDGNERARVFRRIQKTSAFEVRVGFYDNGVFEILKWCHNTQRSLSTVSKLFFFCDHAPPRCLKDFDVVVPPPRVFSSSPTTHSPTHTHTQRIIVNQVLTNFNIFKSPPPRCGVGSRLGNTVWAWQNKNHLVLNI